MSNAFDLVVIGGGPGGYEAAIRAAQLGLNVACIEKRIHKGKPSLGGTCLNVGCIPSKALLDTSHRYHSTQHDLAEHGISTGEVHFDLSKILARKDKVVDQLTSGVAALLKGNGVTWLQGTGKLLANKMVEFTAASGEQTLYTPTYVILASGSTPIYIPAAPVDGEYIVDSTGALEFTHVPQKLAIIGGGVIGLELGSVWKRLGSDVTVFEALDTFLPMLDKFVSKEAYKTLTRQGLNIRLSTKVTQSRIDDAHVHLTLNNAESNTTTETFDRVIVCVGRKPYTEGLLSEDSGIQLTEKGFVAVNEYCLTAVEGVYAIGDLVRGPMLAHKAMEEGVMAVERMLGHKAQVNYNTIISVIYTHPEIAWVGLSEQDAIAQGHTVKIGQFAFAVNGRALAAGETGGFVRIISDEQTDRILGMQIIGAGAGDLIHQGMIGLEFAATTEDFQLMTFAHPTLSEAVHEAALSVDGRAIHAIQRKRR